MIHLDTSVANAMLFTGKSKPTGNCPKRSRLCHPCCGFDKSKFLKYFTFDPKSFRILLFKHPNLNIPLLQSRPELLEIALTDATEDNLTVALTPASG